MGKLKPAAADGAATCAAGVRTPVIPEATGTAGATWTGWASAEGWAGAAAGAATAAGTETG